MKLFFPLIIYILRARYVFGISGAVLRVWGRKREKREKDGFSAFQGAVLLNLTMKYNSCHQRSTTPVVNEVLLLQSMQYYSCLSDYLSCIWLRKNWKNNPCGAEQDYEKRGLVILSARHIAVHRPSGHASFDFAACSDGALNAFHRNLHHVWHKHETHST